MVGVLFGAMLRFSRFQGTPHSVSSAPFDVTKTLEESIFSVFRSVSIFVCSVLFRSRSIIGTAIPAFELDPKTGTKVDSISTR